MQKLVAVFAAAVLGMAAAPPVLAQSVTLPSVANVNAVSAVERTRPGKPKPKPMPGPVAGAGLPLLLIGGAYLLLRRRSRSQSEKRGDVSAE